MPILARMITSDTTTSSSIIVKPFRPARRPAAGLIPVTVLGPSSAVPSLREYTSNTFLPPQLRESGASW